MLKYIVTEWILYNLQYITNVCSEDPESTNLQCTT